jgi:tRNA dimethylallyltransferase
VAAEMGAEVVSVDSMQVYRGMDIGTAKPTLVERRGVHHHMIDLVDPDQDFSVASFASAGRRVIDSAMTPLVISGGSGLHFRALVDPMSFAPTDPGLRARLEAGTPESMAARLLEVDPDAGNHVDLANHRRVVRALEIHQITGETPSERARTAEAEDLRRYVSRVGFTAVGIDPGDQLESRVDRRLASMRSGGFVEEVAGLWEGMGRSARSAVGYRQIGDYLKGIVDLDTALTNAARATKRLARKQRTWFHRDPRIRWIPWGSDPGRLARRVVEEL